MQYDERGNVDQVWFSRLKPYMRVRYAKQVAVSSGYPVPIHGGKEAGTMLYAMPDGKVQSEQDSW